MFNKKTYKKKKRIIARNNDFYNNIHNSSMSSKMRKTYVHEDLSGNYDGQTEKQSISRHYHRARSGSASRLVSSKSSGRVISGSRGKFLSKSAQNLGSMDRLRRLKAGAITKSMKL